MKIRIKQFYVYTQITNAKDKWFKSSNQTPQMNSLFLIKALAKLIIKVSIRQKLQKNKFNTSYKTTRRKESK